MAARKKKATRKKAAKKAAGKAKPPKVHPVKFFRIPDHQKYERLEVLIVHTLPLLRYEQTWLMDVTRIRPLWQLVFHN